MNEKVIKRERKSRQLEKGINKIQSCKENIKERHEKNEKKFNIICITFNITKINR